MNKATALRIKEIRSKKGFSQEKLADETGLNIRTIQRIENGETEPHGHSVKKIAQVAALQSKNFIFKGMIANSLIQNISITITSY